MISCESVSRIAIVVLEQNHARVGEALMKSRKSCACATAADVLFEAIVKGVVADNSRIKTLGILWQLRKIADGLPIIEGSAG